jgi:SAM-dependent methyltransferase
VEDVAGKSWLWNEGRVFHSVAIEEPYVRPKIGLTRMLMLNLVYASHNSSRSVKKALSRLLTTLRPDDWAINIGAGSTKIHPQVINIDIFDEPNIDVVTRGHSLPFKNNSLALAISQEIIEHLEKPSETIAEVHRVLKSGGCFYCQVPFTIGYHSGPHDYWRFTKEGVAALFDSSIWEIQEICISVDHGTGFYRVAVEYVAVTFSAAHRFFYLPAKAVAAIAPFPLKFADLLTPFASEADRIPGGYFCVARKRS